MRASGDGAASGAQGSKVVRGRAQGGPPVGGGAREIGGEAWARWIGRSGALLLSSGASRGTRERVERGEMLARVKGWGELGLWPWRSWAADDGLKRWAGLGCLALLSPSNFLAEKK